MYVGKKTFIINSFELNNIVNVPVTFHANRFGLINIHYRFHSEDKKDLDLNDTMVRIFEMLTGV